MAAKTKIFRDYEVMQTVLERGDAVEYARRISLSPQHVRGWARQPEQESDYATGRTGPLARIAALIAMIREDDGDPARAYPIGRYIAGLLGGVFVPALPPTSSADSAALQRINGALRECSKAVETTRICWFEESPGEITVAEARRCSERIDEAIVSLVQMRRWMEEQR